MIKTQPDPVRRLRRLLIIGIFALILIPVSAAIIWRSLLAREVSARLQAVKHAGLPVNGVELDRWYPAVPDNQNAALIATQAFALLTRFPDVRSNAFARFKLPPRTQPLSPESVTLMAGYVEINEPAIAKLEEALRLPESRYPINLAVGIYTLLPHLGQIKIMDEVLQFKALLAANASDSRECGRDIEMILGMARTLEPEPILISQLVRFSTFAWAVNTLERVLNQNSLAEKDLETLASAFTASEKTKAVARALIGERACNALYFRLSVAEAKRISRDGDEGEPHPNEPPLPGKQATWIVITGFYERDLNFFLQVMQSNIVTVTSEPPQSLAADSSFETAANFAAKHYYTLSSMLLPGYQRAARREAESLARIRLARTALAIERFRATHGKVPANLNDLSAGFSIPNDPFDGAPLRYRVLSNGYVVYSIGADRHDDSGREQPERKKSSDTNSYDITFTVER